MLSQPLLRGGLVGAEGDKVGIDREQTTADSERRSRKLLESTTGFRSDDHHATPLTVPRVAGGLLPPALLLLVVIEKVETKPRIGLPRLRDRAGRVPSNLNRGRRLGLFDSKSLQQGLQHREAFRG